MTEQPQKCVSQRGTFENALFFILVMICLVPVWCLSQIPTNDGPAHLYNAYLLSGWWEKSFPIDRTFFALNPAPVPNWFSTLTLALLMRIFSALTAERLLLTLYVILLPIAFRYTAHSFNCASRYTYLLGFGFVWNHLFCMGFFNFCFSLVWYLFLIGFCARMPKRTGPVQVVVLMALSALLYFSNGLSYYLAAATVGLLSIATLVAEHGSFEWRKSLTPQLGLLLAVPLSIWFFCLRVRSQTTAPSYWGLKTIFWSITRFSILVSSFNPIDLKLAELFGMTLLIAAATICYFRCHRKLVASDIFLLTAALQLILYVVLPEGALGGGAINYRIFLFALATLALWIAIEPLNKTAIVLLSGVATITCIGFVARNLQRDVTISAALDQYREVARYIKPHSSLLRLQFESYRYANTLDPGLRYDPFLNASALVALDRNLVDLDNYETESRNFPVVYRRGFDPMTIIRKEGPGAHRPLADLAQYEAMTGHTIDYVLLWDVQRWNAASPFAKIALDQLSRDYALIYCARDVPLKLYRLRSQLEPSYVTPTCAPKDVAE